MSRSSRHLLSSLGLSLLLYSCSQSVQPTLNGNTDSSDNPYAGGQQYPWTDRLDLPGSSPYAGGRAYPWTGLHLASGLSPQALGNGDNPLSDLSWTSAASAWGPVEKDRSNGEQAGGDGRVLTIGGQTFAKGLGVHANSEIRYALNGQCNAFSAQVGLDDEVGNRGSVTFEVWGDGVRLFDSGVLRGTDTARSLSVPIMGVRELRLVVTNGGDDIDYDHADWALAKVSCAAPPPNGSAYVSDLAYASASNAWGPFEKDRSNGEQAGGDGKGLLIGGQPFSKGLGVHAASALTYNLASLCKTFSAQVGLDDEVGNLGSVTFEVWGDGVKLFDSGVLRGTDTAKAISVPVAGVRELRLVVTNGGDTIDYDHADWADAKVSCDAAGPGPTDTVAPKITLVNYDNSSHLLSGSASDNVALTSVKVYDGSTLIGDAALSGTTWTLKFSATDATTSIKAVAADSAGNTSSDQWTLENTAAATVTNLDHTAMLLRLPTTAGSDTRYTLDGSAVGAQATLYTSPLILRSRRGEPAPLSAIPTTPQDPNHNAWWMWKAPALPLDLLTVVRTQQFKGTVPSTKELSRTYRIEGTPKSLPIVSLMSDPKNFFDDATGIYVPGNVYKANPDWSSIWGTGNYFQSGSAWERPVSIALYDAAGTQLSSQLAGVRIHGSGSSALPEKSLRIYASKDYDASQPLLTTSLLSSSGLTSFKRLILHASGQDSLDTKIKDCAFQSLLPNATLDAMACAPIAVYLDGEYWGLHMLRERYDEYYLSAHHGLDKNNIVVMNGDDTLDVGQDSDVADYTSMVNYFRTTDLTVEANYAAAQTRLDLNNFIDYMAAEIYIGNTDWPVRNIKLWHARTADPASPTYGDGRWRWLLYDTDYAFLSASEPTLANVLVKDFLSESVSTKVIFSSLSRNPAFRKQFSDRMKALLDTTFSSASVAGQITSFYNRVLPEMPAHIDRWHYPVSLGNWQGSVNGMGTFAAQRPAYIRSLLSAYEAGN